METFTATPYRPTGLATADQAMANVVQILEWCAALTKSQVGGDGIVQRALLEGSSEARQAVPGDARGAARRSSASPVCAQA